MKRLPFKQPYNTLIYLFIFFIVVELFSWGLVRFVLHDRVSKWEDDILSTQIINMTWFESSHHYHPYLTYQSEEMRDSLLHKHSDDTFRIGILGGSFAHLFANYLVSKRGKEQLNKLASSNGVTRPIGIVNLASGGYRQPQQLIASVLYHEKVDAFISIEGLNELISSWPLSCYQRYWNKQTLRFKNHPFSIFGLMAKGLKNIFLGLTSPSMRSLSSNKLWMYFFSDFLYRGYFSLETKYLKQLKGNCENSGESPVHYWKKDIEKHHLVLKGMGKELVTIMQPNQYLPDSKPLSSKEQELFRGDNGLKNKVESLYPDAIFMFNGFVNANPKNYIDMTSIFKNNSETLYKDSCCHVNDQGNQIFLEALFPTIQRIINP